MDGEYVYRERQVGWGLWVGLGAALCIGLPVHAGVDPQAALWPHAALLGLFGLLALGLGRLTVEVGGGELRWHFGWFGWPRWRVALNDIVRIEACRTRWWDGWGLRRTPEGWLYNMAGMDALRVVCRNGRSFRLGSADVAGLCRALEPRLTR